jgi:hypothetical protein
VILAFLLSILIACDDSYIDEIKDPLDNTNEYKSVAAFGTWLSAQPANTAATAYEVALNVNDISYLKTALDNAPNKYVYLDLSGSTIPNIPEHAFLYCTSLTSVTMPNSVTSIEYEAFYDCTRLTSVIFEGTIPSSGFSPTAFSSIGDLRKKFYATDSSNGTPGTYTKTKSAGEYSEWTKQ